MLFRAGFEALWIGLLDDFGAALGGPFVLPEMCGATGGSGSLAFRVWKLPTLAMLSHLTHANAWAIVTSGAGARDKGTASSRQDIVLDPRLLIMISAF